MYFMRHAMLCSSFLLRQWAIWAQAFIAQLATERSVSDRARQFLTRPTHPHNVRMLCVKYVFKYVYAFLYRY